MNCEYSDLSLIDELLIDRMRSCKMAPEDMESGRDGVLSRYAIRRLRAAWESGEMKIITLTWANYFKRTKL